MNTDLFGNPLPLAPITGPQSYLLDTRRNDAPVSDTPKMAKLRAASVKDAGTLIPCGSLHCIRVHDAVMIHGGSANHRPMWTRSAQVIAVSARAITVEADGDEYTYRLDADGWHDIANLREPIRIA